MSLSPYKSKLKEVGHLTIPEMEVSGKKKDYPSISDYYKAASHGDKPIKYQHGLSNFSSVQLGDDRVYFKKSLTQEAYQLDTVRAEQMALSDVAPAQKTFKQRKMDYAEAKEIVGATKINEMEQMMRDKLQQRTKTGPFQLRRTFKYFDRDGSGGIDFSEFQRAMELLGFQFTEIQQLALFSRYDESCTGEVDYAEFIEKVMESDFKGVVETAHGKHLNSMVASAFALDRAGRQDEADIDDDSDCDDEEREMFTRSEVKKLFEMVDKDKSGYISVDELSHMLSRLGRELSKEQFENGFKMVDTDNSGQIDFEEFYMWFKKSDASRSG